MKSRLVSIVLAAAMLAGLCACRKTTANEMKLLRTEGAAHVSDENRVEQKIRENMNLYTGYEIGTEESSFAWINLDSVKLLTLNESSDAVLEKDGRKLRVVLQSGDMFFCVLEDLGDDEALELKTGNMSMAIRGTCGIVRVLSERESQLVLLEGKVTVSDTAGMVRQDVETGQVLNLYVKDDGTASLTLREIRSDDILDFAREYIDEDTQIQEKIEDGGGTVDYTDMEVYPSTEPHPVIQLTEAQAMEIYADVIETARDALQKKRSGKDIQHSHPDFPFIYVNAEWLYTLYDVNLDGAPELLIGRTDEAHTGTILTDCWTTDGITPIRVKETYLSSGYLEITANGYLVEYRGIAFNDWWYCSIDPFGKHSAYHEKAHLWAIGDISHPESCLYTYEDNRALLDNATEAEYQAFIDAYYPRVPIDSLSWHSLA